MEQIIALVAVSIMAIGLIVLVIGLITFTRCFGNPPQAPPENSTAPNEHRIASAHVNG